MRIRGATRAIPRRVLVGAGLVLAVILGIAFVSTAVEAYRLRTWRDELVVEIAEMERERDTLEQELRKRDSVAWVDEQLRQAGLVPPGVVRVVAMPAQSESAAEEGPSEAESPQGAFGGGLFDNPHWEGWMNLIFGFDQ